MALASQKSENFYTTSGSDADLLSATKLAYIKDLWDKDSASGRNITTMIGDPHLGPILYALQQMQDEIIELRRYIVSAELLVDAGGGSLPTSDPRVSGELWCDTRSGNVIKVSS